MPPSPLPKNTLSEEGLREIFLFEEKIFEAKLQNSEPRSSSSCLVEEDASCVLPVSALASPAARPHCLVPSLEAPGRPSDSRLLSLFARTVKQRVPRIQSKTSPIPRVPTPTCPALVHSHSQQWRRRAGRQQTASSSAARLVYLYNSRGRFA